jgi:hypothetical protein
MEALHIYTVLTDVVTGDRAFLSNKKALAISWGKQLYWILGFVKIH